MSISLLVFSYIFKDKIINSSKFGTINLHAGKLPKYRGGSPLNWQIINNEKKIGLSIIKITKKIGQRTFIVQISFSIKKQITSIQLNKKATNFLRKL